MLTPCRRYRCVRHCAHVAVLASRIAGMVLFTPSAVHTPSVHTSYSRLLILLQILEPLPNFIDWEGSFQSFMWLPLLRAERLQSYDAAKELLAVRAVSYSQEYTVWDKAYTSIGMREGCEHLLHHFRGTGRHSNSQTATKTRATAVVIVCRPKAARGGRRGD